ncbi:MAG: hypothetical protein H0U85_06930 [Gemmatimonadales bacterium]|nr:hypothetical protein [Gemmatimonadales bacterium]
MNDLRAEIARFTYGGPAGSEADARAAFARSGRGAAAGISLHTPVIAKYRDEQTDASAALEELLR